MQTITPKIQESVRAQPGSRDRKEEPGLRSIEVAEKEWGSLLDKARRRTLAVSIAYISCAIVLLATCIRMQFATRQRSGGGVDGEN